MQTRQNLNLRLTAVDEWLILSKRNFKFDLGDVLFFPSAKNERAMEMKAKIIQLLAVRPNYRTYLSDYGT